MLVIYHDLDAVFSSVLEGLDCRNDTRAYIIGIYSQHNNPTIDLSHHNLTLTFLQARHNYNFYDHQKIGDWIFFVNSMFPQFFDDNAEYYRNMARLSYYSCYKLINKKWPLYEELADRFITLEEEAKEKLATISILPK